jgi:hypothetical protein
MDYTVRFRVNKQTGQVELFDVDHEGPQSLDDAEHNRRHEQLAAEIGRQIERDPSVLEMVAGALPDTEAEAEAAIDTETQARKEQEKKAE